ncbi:MAG: hypothetical protein ACK5Q5_20015 [Planctomycetaceae bacterium]
MFAESLTVRILADSSHFRADLDALLASLGRLRESVQAVAEGGSAIGDSFGQLSRAMTPLQQISKLLSTIQSQLRTISQTPLMINVEMAMASLTRLAGMIDLVAAKLNSLSSAGGGGGSSAGPPGGLPGGGFGSLTTGGATPLLAKSSALTSLAMPQLASTSAPVRSSPLPGPGEAQWDWRSIASAMSRLTPEPQIVPSPVVLTRPAPQDIALTTTATVGPSNPPEQALQRNGPLQSQSTAEPQRGSIGSTNSTNSTLTTNHFGGITINVRETADVNTLVRDLRLQGIHLRNRRG